MLVITVALIVERHSIGILLGVQGLGFRVKGTIAPLRYLYSVFYLDYRSLKEGKPHIRPGVVVRV